MDENLLSRSCVLLSQNCHTHVGIGVKYIPEQSLYKIYAILSQKHIAIVASQSLKDGVVLKCQMLSPNYYLYGVQMIKNKNIPVVMLGPANIHFDGNTTFTIHIPSKQWSIIKLSSRYVFLYLQNTFNDIIRGPFTVNHKTSNVFFCISVICNVGSIFFLQTQHRRTYFCETQSSCQIF